MSRTVPTNRRPARGAVILTILLVFFGAQALADAVVVHGLAHQPLGQAVVEPAPGQTGAVLVSNIGAAGDDGVEIVLNSAYGGNAALDIPALLNIPGATFGSALRGWDGVVYGVQSLVSNGDGTGTLVFDFTDLGAPEIRVVEYAESGVVISDTTYAGPILAKPWVPNFTCPDGGTPVPVWGWRRVCPTCPEFWWIGWACIGTGPTTTYTYESHRMVVTPTFPPGVPAPLGFESMSITASGLSSLTVSDASLATFNVQSWGLGQAGLSEQCDAPGGCLPGDQQLFADNLGSSGNDGVAIDIGPNIGGFSVGIGKGTCCRGHVIIMKAFDDEGREQRITRTQIDELEDVEELDADFSSMGATGFILTLFDGMGGVLGPPEGTFFINGGAKPVWTNRCPPGAVEVWVNEGTTSNPVWVFQGCSSYMDFVLPGYGTVTDVASFQVEPADASSSVGRLTRFTLTSEDPEGLTVRSVQLTPYAVGDLNCDGVVNYGDIDPFVEALTGWAGYAAAFPGCGWLNADCNGDGTVNYADIDAFVAVLSGGG